jgi:hypothetical protein
LTRARLGAAIDVDASVAGIVQDVQDATMPQGLPDQFASVPFAPESIWEEQTLLGEVLDDSQCGTCLLEKSKEHLDGLLHFFVGVFDQSTRRVEKQADRRTHA